jgi:hypothetical protein
MDRCWEDGRWVYPCTGDEMDGLLEAAVIVRRVSGDPDSELAAAITAFATDDHRSVVSREVADLRAELKAREETGRELAESRAVLYQRSSPLDPEWPWAEAVMAELGHLFPGLPSFARQAIKDRDQAWRELRAAHAEIERLAAVVASSGETAE